jgi:hypothetical protein
MSNQLNNGGYMELTEEHFECIKEENSEEDE